MARTLTALLAIICLGFSDPALASGFGRSGKGSSGSGRKSGASASGTPAASSAGPVTTVHAAPSPHHPHGVYRPFAAYASPYYYGPYYSPFFGGYSYYAGWGFAPYGYYARGYHPYWGAPIVTEPVDPASERSFSLWLGGLVSRSWGAPAMDLRLEGADFGFDLRATLLGSERLDGGADGMPLWSVHGTYSLVSTPQSRVRFEAGLSSVSAPDATYVGPDLGVTAQVAIVGPLGVYGGAHVTPFPARIVDVGAGLALQFGGLGCRVGYRAIVLDDRALYVDPNGGGIDLIRGLQASVGLVF